jgi:hypothetical protein
MNSLTKQRYISTSIWSDDWFDSLTEREKLFYFYLLTNQHTTPAGIYPCTIRDMRAEFNVTREEVLALLKTFEEAGKAFYYKEYIIIPKWLKHQKIEERSRMFLGALKVLRALPDELKEFVRERRHYDFDVTPYIGAGKPRIPEPQEAVLSIELPIEREAVLQAPPVASAVQEGNDSALLESDGLVLGYPENVSQKRHDLDLDSEMYLNLRLNTHSVCGAKELAVHFIKRWQETPDIFNWFSHLKKPKEWRNFWYNNPFTAEQIDRALDNFIEAVRAGVLERRYTPSTPDKFVLNGWIPRSLNDFKSASKRQERPHRLENDFKPDDTGGYFKEA